MDAYRQAAMCLHGLEDSDRDWLLNRLPEEHTAVLSKLLSELKTLGIPREPGFSREVLADFPAMPGRKPNDDVELEQAPSEVIWLTLQHESVAVIRALSMGRDWPWRAYVLKQYRKKHRRDLPAGRPVGSKAFQALVSIIARRVRENAAYASPSAVRISWFRRLRKRLWRR